MRESITNTLPYNAVTELAESIASHAGSRYEITHVRQQHTNWHDCEVDWPAPSLHIYRRLHDSWTDKYQELVAVVLLAVGPEQESDVRQVAERRHFRRLVVLGLRVNAADDDRAAVLHQYVGRDLLGIDRGAGRSHCPHAVLVNVQIHDDVIVRRNLRLHFERQRGFFE